MMMMMMIKGTTCLIIDNMHALVGHLALCSNATKPFIWSQTRVGMYKPY